MAPYHLPSPFYIPRSCIKSSGKYKKNSNMGHGNKFHIMTVTFLQLLNVTLVASPFCDLFYDTVSS
jgi:hypothetical protein